MTAMNWEAAKRKQGGRDGRVEELPITGSFEDQRRYGVFLGRPGHHRKARSGAVVIHRPIGDLAQLQSWLDAVSHADFRRRSEAQRADLLDGLKKIVDRCRQWQHQMTPENLKLLQKGERACVARRH